MARLSRCSRPCRQGLTVICYCSAEGSPETRTAQTEEAPVAVPVEDGKVGEAATAANQDTKAAEGSEYSSDQQSQQAGSACKQS